MAFRRLAGYVFKRKKILVTGILATTVSTIMSVIFPQIARIVVDILVSGKIGIIPYYALALVVISLIAGVSWYIQRLQARKLSELVTFDLRVELYNKIQEISLSFIYQKGAGQLMSRATADLEEIRRLVMFMMIWFTQNILLLLFSIISMMLINPFVAVASYLVLLPLPYIFYRFAKSIRSRFMTAREIYGEITSFLRESILGILAIKSLVAEKSMQRRFGYKVQRYWDEMFTIGKLRSLVWPTFSVFAALSFATIYYLGSIYVARGEMTVGDVVGMGFYISMITWPMASIGFAITRLEASRAAARRVFEILDAKSEVEEDPNAVDFEIKRGKVEYRDVWFTYDGKRWVLQGLNLKINPGEIVAITGPPGGGKSSLAMLLLRLYDPQRGEILVDDFDIKKMKIASLRRQIGIVHQDIYLFPDTFRNNIAYAKPDASMEEVVRAAKMANIHDFIVSLPDGYNTNIGERGVTLSGGQRQRIAIARTLLADPKIIILDDSTSEVDAETEKAIYDALTKHFRGRTIIVITQRPSTMKLADRVVVIKNGKVVKEGPPEEIIREMVVYGVEV